jgi:hypothetical protein
MVDEQCPSDPFMKNKWEKMWEGQDQNGWTKLTHARRMGIRALWRNLR